MFKSLVEVKTYDLKTGPRGEIRENINMNIKLEKNVTLVMNWFIRPHKVLRSFNYENELGGRSKITRDDVDLFNVWEKYNLNVVYNFFSFNY